MPGSFPVHWNLCKLYGIQPCQSLDLWSAAVLQLYLFPIHYTLCELYRFQTWQSLGLWSAAVLPGALSELYHNQSAQPLGLWSAAGLGGNLLYCWCLGSLPFPFPCSFFPFDVLNRGVFPFSMFPFICSRSFFPFPFVPLVLVWVVMKVLGCWVLVGL